MIKRWYAAHKERVHRLAWGVVEAVIASGIGLLAATLYLRSR